MSYRLPEINPDHIREDAWVVCPQCRGTGLDGHACDEKKCRCRDLEDNMTCFACGGSGGWREQED